MPSTIIGSDLILDGTLTSQDDVQIAGTVRGPVSTQAHLDVAPSGAVEADVAGHTITIAGTVHSNVTAAERVDLLAGGRLVGDVKAPRFTIADGGTFRGKVDMEP